MNRLIEKANLDEIDFQPLLRDSILNRQVLADTSNPSFSC
jgi:hypothetical protein